MSHGVEVPAHTGAPKFSTGTGTPERLRRRREEPATRGAGGRPRQVAGGSHRLSDAVFWTQSVWILLSAELTALIHISPLSKYLTALFPEEITPTYHTDSHEYDQPVRS